MAFKHITSRDNPVYKHLRKLADHARERKKAGYTLIEGVHLLEAYVQIHGEPRLLIIPEGASSAEASALLQQLAEVDTLMLPTLLYADLTPVASSQGIMAMVPVAPIAPPPQITFALLIEAIQDPGNLGSMLRTAAAAGVEVVYLSKGCTDAWSPKALRGGQGAHFILPMVEDVDAHTCVAQFSGTTLALTLKGSSLYAQSLQSPVLLVVGNEGAGVTPALQASVQQCVTIPMARANPLALESLNAAAATAIALFECKRQREAPHS